MQISLGYFTFRDNISMFTTLFQKYRIFGTILFFLICFKNLGRNKSFVLGHWYPYLGLQVMSAIGFKGQCGSPNLHFSSPSCDGFLRFTASVTPAVLLKTNIAVVHFWPTYFFKHWLKHWRSSSLCNSVRQTGALTAWAFPTRHLVSFLFIYIDVRKKRE